MGYTIDDVIYNWAIQSGRKKKSYSVYYEDDTIYSYGRHFPMAIHMRSKTGERWILYNTDSYSSTTASHQSSLLRCIVDTQNFSKRRVIDAPFRVLESFGLSLRKLEIIDEVVSPAPYGIRHNIFMSNCSLLTCSNTKNKYLITYDHEIWDRHVVIQVGKKHKTIVSAILSLFPKEIIRYVKGLTEEENHLRRIDVLTIGTLFLLSINKQANENKSSSLLHFKSYDDTAYQARNVLEIGNDVYVSGWIKNGDVNNATSNVISRRGRLTLGNNLYKILESKSIAQARF